MRNLPDISSGNRYTFHLHPAAQATAPATAAAAAQSNNMATTVAATATAAAATTAIQTSATNEQKQQAQEAHTIMQDMEHMETSKQQQQQHNNNNKQALSNSHSHSNNNNNLIKSKLNNLTKTTATTLKDNCNSVSSVGSAITPTPHSTALLHRKQFTLTSDTSNASFSSASVAGSMQDDMSDRCSLTQAGLEEYNIRASSYYDQPVLYHHQKQSSYAQSEGYHSYVSSSDSSSATPFLDRLRQESDLLSRQSHHWSQNDLSSVSCASVAPSPTPLISAGNGRMDIGAGGGKQQQQQLNHSNNGNNNNNSSESTSSTETLKWLGSMSDVSEASHNTGYSGLSESVSSSQLIVHSSRVLTPKRHHSESVLYLHDEAQQQHSPNGALSLNPADMSPHEQHSPPTRAVANHRHSPSYPPVHTSLTLYAAYQEPPAAAHFTTKRERETSAPDLRKSSLATSAASSSGSPATVPSADEATAAPNTPPTAHKSSISVTISSSEPVVAVSPQPPILAGNKAAVPASGMEAAATVGSVAPLGAANGCATAAGPTTTPAPLTIVTNSVAVYAATTASPAASPLTSSPSAACRSNHRLFPVSTYTEPVHSNTSQFVHHPKPQYSTGLQKPLAAQLANSSPSASQAASSQFKGPPTQSSPQSSWQSVAELINDFERSNDQPQPQPQQYTYIEPSKTHRVSNPALKAFQKNAVQSYFERQQQQQHSKEHNPQKLYQPQAAHHHQQQQQQHQHQHHHHHQQQQQQQQQQILRPHSFQASSNTKDAVAGQQLLRNSLPNTYGPLPPHAACLQPGTNAMRGMPQRPALPPSEDSASHMYATATAPAKPPSPAPPPPPPRSRSLMPSLLRRSSSASDYADFRDQYMRASQEKLQAQSIKNISSAEKLSFNDCGMPPPPPPPRGLASLPARRTSSASEYAAMRDKVLLQQAAALAHHQHHPHQHNLPPARTHKHYYATPPAAAAAPTNTDGWVPERPPKNPHLRVPSPDLPPPPADLDTSLSDEPLPPPPPEILHRQAHYEDATSVSLHGGEEPQTQAPSPNRRNSFAGSSTRRSFFSRSASAANEAPSSPSKVPPLIPKKPANIELLHMVQLPTSSKAQKVLLNGSAHKTAPPVPQTGARAAAANRKRPHHPAAVISVPPIMEHTAMGHIKSTSQAVTTKASPPPPLMPRMPTTSGTPGQGVSVAINSKLRCNSKASYLPRQSLEKLNNSDPDHGSYKLTLTSNEDLVAHTKPSYDMLAHNGKIPSNLPDVLPLGAKLQPHQHPQSASPTSSNGTCLRYGSNNSLATTNSPTQQQQATSCYPPMHLPQHHRYSTPAMSAYSKSNSSSSTTHMPSYARSQSFDLHSNNSSPTKIMSQSTIDLKRTHILEPTLEETSLPEASKVLSPAQSENNLYSGGTQKSSSNVKQLSPCSARREFHRSDHSGKLCLEEGRNDAAEGRIFRAELVNTTLATSPCGTAHKTVTRKDSLRENIEKITQLQSQLMSAHLSDSGSLLSGFAATKPAPLTAKSPIVTEEHKPHPDALAAEEQQQHTADADCDIVGTSTATSILHTSTASTETDPPPPALPQTPPPIQHSSDETNATVAEQLFVVTQIAQMDSSTDGLKLMQRSELILRVNASTSEACSQTDDLLDCDLGRLVVNHAKEETQTRTTLQPRQRHPIELDCDSMCQELASMLSPSDKLIEILAPQPIKCATDYVGNLYNPDVPLRPVKRDVGTSTLMRMKTREARESSPECSMVTVDLQYTEVEVALTNGNNESDSCDALKQKVDELIRQLNRKIRILSKEQTTIGEESANNDELGRSLIDKLADKVRPIEATKCRTYIDDVGHITSLLLSLSERLARVENSLSTLAESNAEKKLIESKRDRLLEQLEEAKRLKEDIDRRGSTVTGVLEKYLNADEFAHFDYFINMKAKLIADARDIADKIKCGEEQLVALSEALTQSDC